MKKRFLTHTIVCLLLVGATSAADSEELNMNLLQSTPVGSWQLREDTNTDHKGRQTVAQVRTSLVGEETRDGEKSYWMEVAMNTFSVKKGERKPTGDTLLMKSLIAESALQSDPANVVTNMRAFGKEIIMQSGDQDPLLMRDAGAAGQSMLQAMGAKVNYAYTVVGNEDITVKAGNFPARKFQGTGTTEFKVLFKKINVTSNNTAWLSDKVPFGIVKSEGESISNGKKSTHVSELLEYGNSGATTQITKTPQELPAMPNMKDIFGQ